MYWLELAGEEDAFATYEAGCLVPGVELLAPGIARAGRVGDEVVRLAYTRAAHEAIGRTDATIASAVAALRATSIDRTGSVAVRARDVRGTAEISTERAERDLGQVLVDRGFDVDLDDPDHVLRALFAAGDRADHRAVEGADGEVADVCVLGWRTVVADRDFARKPTDRPFFQPGSMAPVDARAYVNIARAGPGRTLLDPMCGTGGIPLEAGAVGARVVAADAQAKMVRGTRRNLRALLNGTDWTVLRGDATRLPIVDDGVDCVVFDAPYGRQSKIERHELADLVTGALTEANRTSDRTVLIADRDWRSAAIDAGWNVTARFSRRVHRSLTRHVLVLTDGPGGAEETVIDPPTKASR
ncbi:methyltransferase domain-containing protein [Halopenitus sp. POP-27]|uniref:methyltransferase domain-containing protein n=1 Tax=Halopenitus sp. POP-27 TaxID=2994425 RepID=UPI002468DC29|nr:methyltransferase domain-containing protein [Halopenitus sp. POP-27]